MSGPTVHAVSVQGLHKSFRARPALQAIDLDIAPGERVALLGASGSGKSTLLRCLSGLERADAGRVCIGGAVLQDRGTLSPAVRRLRRGIGTIFQQFNLVGRLSVMDNVLMGLVPTVPLWRSLRGGFREGERALALEALTALGLGEQAFQRASTLSGGQQQRAAIARVLVQGARLVLADEPVASLDPESTRRVMEHLLGLNRHHGLTLVVSLHDVALARQYCSRIVALRDGRLVHDGPAESLTPRLVAELYGSAAHELTARQEPTFPTAAALAAAA